METAIHSESAIIKTWKKVEDDTKNFEQEAKKSDVQVSALSNYPAWEEMKKEVLDPLIKQYEQPVIEMTDTPEMVGYRTLVSSNIVSILKMVRDLPETILEAGKINGRKDGGEPDSLQPVK